jgi:uncharacterized membrane protein
MEVSTHMRKISVRQIALAAVVAALYTVLSYFANIFGLAYGPIQCRFSEALCVLPFFFPETTWGLFVGCILTNLLSAYGPIDIIFGSLATLLAALCTAKMKNKWLAPLPPVIANGVIVSAVIAYSEAGSLSAFFPLWAYNALTVAVGEAIACYVLGMLILFALPKIKFFRDMIPENKLK